MLALRKPNFVTLRGKLKPLTSTCHDPPSFLATLGGGKYLSDEATRQEFEALLVEGLSARAAARAVGISPSTGIAWAAKWKQKNDGTPEGPVGADEERVANLLLAKAELLLSGIVNEPGSKAKLEVAGAVEKLLGKYLSFVGKATEQHVTIDGQSSADLDKLLKQLLPEGSGVV